MLSLHYQYSILDFVESLSRIMYLTKMRKIFFYETSAGHLRDDGL